MVRAMPICLKLKKTFVFVFILFWASVPLFAENGEEKEVIELDNEGKAPETSSNERIDFAMEKIDAVALKEVRTWLEEFRQNSNKRLHKIDKKLDEMTAERKGDFPRLLTPAVLLIFFFLLKYLLSQKIGRLENEIRKNTEAVNSKIVELESMRASTLETRPEKPETSPGPDSPFFLKTGLEIFRMRKRLDKADADTKNLKSIKNSLKRLESEYNDLGYEIVDLTGKPFVEGMTIRARFVPSDELDPGESVITRVIEPQINYNGLLIQPAEVEVGTGA